MVGCAPTTWQVRRKTFMPKGYIRYVDEEFPEISSYFVHPKEAHIGMSSTKKKEFICKCCSEIFVDEVRNVVRRGVATCISCRDGVSYPEKFMCSLLDQLNIKFELHYYSEWTNGYYYDFAFDYKNDKYILEMDGGLGHGHYGFKNTDVSKTIEVDKIKDKLAIQNGFKIIRIDCNYRNNCSGRYEYVKENTIKELSDIFDLDIVDFDVCNKYALGSLFYEVVDFYKTQSKYIDDIIEKFHLKKTCIRSYLKHAMKMGLLPQEYLHDYDRFKGFPVPIIRFYKNEEVRNSKIVYCYDDAIAFDSIEALANYLDVSRTMITYQIKHFNGKILGKTYCFYDDLPSDFNFEPITTMRTRYRAIYQYTKDKQQLLNKYENKSYLPSEFDYSRVVSVCNGSRKSHRGFWWSYINIFDTQTA